MSLVKKLPSLLIASLLTFLSAQLYSLVTEVYFFSAQTNTGNTHKVILCGDNHVAGTWRHNLHQFAKLVKSAQNSHVVAENMYMPCYDDEIDTALLHYKHAALLACINEHFDNDRIKGHRSQLALWGMPAKFYKKLGRLYPLNLPQVATIKVTNIECRNKTTFYLEDPFERDIAYYKKVKKYNKSHYLADLFSLKTITHYIHHSSSKPIFEKFFISIKDTICQDQKIFFNLLKQRGVPSNDLRTKTIHQLITEYWDELQDFFNEYPCVPILDEMIEASIVWHLYQDYQQPDPSPTIVLAGFDHINLVARILTTCGYTTHYHYALEPGSSPDPAVTTMPNLVNFFVANPVEATDAVAVLLSLNKLSASALAA